MKHLERKLALLLCCSLLLGLLVGCGSRSTTYLEDRMELPGTDDDPGEDLYFPIENTVWQGEDWLVFLPDGTLLAFDEAGEKTLQDTYEWYGVTGKASMLLHGPYLQLEGDTLQVFGNDELPTATYTQTDRIPGTDPADGYILENTTWHCVTNDKYTFYEDGRVTLHNWYLSQTYEGTYEWDIHTKTGSLTMDDYTTDLALDEDGYLCLVDREGDPQQAGRGVFEKVTDFFALRGQEAMLEGRWYAADRNTWLTFDGAGDVIYTDADGEDFPLRSFTHGYFFDGSKLTLITGVIVRTGQPDVVYGGLNEDGTLSVNGDVYERTEP